MDELITDHYQGSRAAKRAAEKRLELDQHLQQNTHLMVEAIMAYVEQTYNVLYTVSGMTDLLHRLNFTYKQSKLVPAKANAQQQKFLEDLKNIQETKGKNAPVLYRDSVHPQHNTMLAYG